MTTQKNWAILAAPPGGNAPSSGDGASSESAYDPSTGARNDSYSAPQESTSTRTIAYGSTAAHADIAAAYGPERARYCGIGSDGSAGGLGVGATDHFSRYSGGGDDIGLQDSDLGAGGKSIGG